jgi:hypothetical protein
MGEGSNAASGAAALPFDPGEDILMQYGVVSQGEAQP